MDIYNVYIFYRLDIQLTSKLGSKFQVYISCHTWTRMSFPGGKKRKKVVIASDGMLKIRPCFFKTNHRLSWLKFN